MKAILKPKRIEMLEVYEVKKENLPFILHSDETLKQELLIENDKIILREESKEDNDTYKSTTNIDIYLKENDLLVKLDKGYTKYIAELRVVDKKLEKAIEEINSRN